MKLADYKGYQIHIPTSGGKAGKGCNVTSTIQVFGPSHNGSRWMEKAFRFTVASAESRQAAMHKARLFIDAKPTP